MIPASEHNFDEVNYLSCIYDRSIDVYTYVKKFKKISVPGAHMHLAHHASLSRKFQLYTMKIELHDDTESIVTEIEIQVKDVNGFQYKPSRPNPARYSMKYVPGGQNGIDLPLPNYNYNPDQINPLVIEITALYWNVTSK